MDIQQGLFSLSDYLRVADSDVSCVFEEFLRNCVLRRIDFVSVSYMLLFVAPQLLLTS